ncbi:response regulator [Altericista sp. CCNU0014]|uniref:response regulator n=1 Tax=Altericista sp. CCNU0014 TaxID=3082949 RepID=UPI0038506433
MVEAATKRILAIDSEPNMQKIVQTCLTTLGGWEVQLATSAQEGLNKAAIERPDAILMEGTMPAMKIADFLAQLQANPITRSIPVVFLTEQASLTERHRFLELGAVGAIAKPFDPLTLAAKIAAILGWEIDR